MKIFAIVLIVLLAACARNGSGSSTTPAPSASSGVSHPTAADELVFSWAQEGGFAPAADVLTRIPNFALLGDGTVITPGAQIMIYPGPFLPSLQARQLSEAGVRQLLAMLLDSGAFERSAELTDMGNIADASTAVFKLNAGGRNIMVSAYALTETSEFPVTSPAEAQVREALLGVIEELEKLESADVWVEDEWQSISPPALRLYVTPRPANGEGEEFRNERAWPLSVAPDQFGQSTQNDYRCDVVADEELAALLPQLQRANSETVWLHEDVAYQLIAKPLLHKPFDCGEAGASGY